MAETRQEQLRKLDEEDAAIVQRALDFCQQEHDKILVLLGKKVPHRAPSSQTPATALPLIAGPAAMISNLAIFHRIYVGSVQFDISDAEVEAVFAQFGCLRSVSLMQDPANQRHRGYGFLEYDTPEGAALALQQMDGAELGGRSIRVGRPNNFPSDLPPGVPRPLANRIYIANIHELVQEDELKLIAQAFGPVRYCHLAPDPLTKRHKGYGFVEYEHEEAARKAIATLHNFELAKRTLKVGKTIVGGPMPSGMASLKDGTTAPTVWVNGSCFSAPISKPRVPSAVLRAVQQINQTLGQAVSAENLEAPPIHNKKEEEGEPKTVMLLENMEDATNLRDPKEVAELEADVADECIKFGPVDRVRVYIRPDQTVAVYVKFKSAESLPGALQVMHNRWFAGRQIKAVPADSI